MFFEFNQNNSGGGFDYNEQRGISHFVIVEADDWKEANAIAEDIGLYFDGCDDGRDCPCCGDRWYAQWRNEKGTDVPTVYGEPVEEVKGTTDWSLVSKDGYMTKWMKGYEVFVHYKDGTIKGYVK